MDVHVVVRFEQKPGPATVFPAPFQHGNRLERQIIVCVDETTLKLKREQTMDNLV